MGGLNSEATPLDIVEWPSYGDQIGRLGISQEELDDKLWGILFLIARLPRYFEQARKANGSPLCSADYRENGLHLRVWFVYRPGTAVLMSITRYY